MNYLRKFLGLAYDAEDELKKRIRQASSNLKYQANQAIRRVKSAPPGEYNLFSRRTGQKIDNLLDFKFKPNRPTIRQAIKMTAPKITENFARDISTFNFGKRKYSFTPVYNVAKSIGEGEKRFLKSAYDWSKSGVFGKTKAAFEGLVGGASALAPASPYFQAANLVSSLPENKYTNVPRRLSKGFLEGMTQTKLAPNVKEEKTFNIPILNTKIDPAKTAGEMVGFVKHPFNEQLFKVTEAILPMEAPSIKRWLGQTATRGALENLVLSMPEMPQGDNREKAKYLLENLGFGALSEIFGQGLFKGGGKVMDAAGAGLRGVGKLSGTAVSKLSKFYDALASTKPKPVLRTARDIPERIIEARKGDLVKRMTVNTPEVIGWDEFFKGQGYKTKILMPEQTGVGALMGIETYRDDDGKLQVRFNPTKAVGGMLLTGALQSKGSDNIIKAKLPEDVTLKSLKNLEGKTIINKQFIYDMANRGDIKQAEREILRKVADSMPEGKINVQEFINKVRKELLPLDTDLNSKGGSGFYESVTLPDELRGDVADYYENVYQSPIKTKAGDVHFGGNNMYNLGADDIDKPNRYFAHTRIEDMADNATRRVIELQSDLFQRGRIKNEEPRLTEEESVWGNATRKELERFRKQAEEAVKQNGYGADLAREALVEIDRADKILKKKEAEYKKLLQNRNTWYERLIREEVKKAAQDGKTKLQFPTGETAMQIEGLGSRDLWEIIPEGRNDIARSDAEMIKLTPSNIKVGQTISMENFVPNEEKYIVVEVLDDGKFKAVPKSAINKYNESYFDDYLTAKRNRKEALQKWIDAGLKKHEAEELLNESIEVAKREILNLQETFDISGKIDTDDPVYRFYEKQVQRYLKKKYPSMRRVTDENGVSWFEIDVPKEAARLPVEAFGIGAGIEIERDENGRPTGRVRFNTNKALAGMFAVGALRGKELRGRTDDMYKLFADSVSPEEARFNINNIWEDIKARGNKDDFQAFKKAVQRYKSLITEPGVPRHPDYEGLLSDIDEILAQPVNKFKTIGDLQEEAKVNKIGELFKKASEARQEELQKQTQELAQKRTRRPLKSQSQLDNFFDGIASNDTIPQMADTEKNFIQDTAKMKRAEAMQEAVFGNVDDVLKEWLGRKEAGKTIATEIASKYADIPREKAQQVIDYMEGLTKDASPDVKQWSAKLKKDFDQLHNALVQLAEKNGLDVGYWKNYVPHYWKEPPEVVAEKFQQYLKRKKSLQEMKRRKIPTYKEGIEAGLTPKFTHPAEMLEQYVKNMQSFMAGMKLFEDMKKNGMIVPASVGRNQPDFEPIRAPGFGRNETFIDGKIVEGDWYAPTEVAREVSKLFSPERETNLGKVVGKMADFSKRLQEVTLSGGVPKTPVNAFAIAQLTKELISGRVRSPLKAFVAAMSEPNTQKFFTEHASEIKEMQRQGIPIRSSFKVSNLIDKPTIKKVFGDDLGEAWHKLVDEPTFGKFMPMLQISLYKEVKDGALKKGASPDEAAKLAATVVQKFYGLTNSLSEAKRSQLTKDFLSAFTFAPKYRESMINLWLNTAKALKNPLAPENRMNSRFALGAVLTYAGMSALNKALNGHFMHENPEGKRDKLLVPAGKYTIGIPFLSSIATLPRMGAAMVGKLAKADIEGAALEGRKALSMAVKPMVDLMANEDYFGREIVSDTDTPREKLNKQAEYLFKSYVGHPYIKALIELKTKPDQPLYQRLSMAMEMPFRFYETEKVKNQPFWEQYNKVKKIGEKYNELRLKDPAKANDFLNEHEDDINRLNLMKAYLSLYYRQKEEGQEPTALQEFLSQKEPKKVYEQSPDAPRSKIAKALLYLHSGVVNPIDTVKAIKTGQPIRKMRGDATVLEREIAPTDRDPNTQKDHRIPLWAGGTNDDSNTYYLTVEDHRKKTAFEAKLRKKLENGEMSKKEVQEAIKQWHIDNKIQSVAPPIAREPDLTNELPTDKEELQYVYNNALKTVEGYKQRVTEAKYLKSYRNEIEKQLKLQDLEKEKQQAEELIKRIEKEYPDKVLEFQINAYRSGGGHNVEERTDWIYEQLQKSKDPDKLIKAFWDAKVLTSGKKGTAAKLKEKYGIDVSGRRSSGRSRKSSSKLEKKAKSVVNDYATELEKLFTKTAKPPKLGSYTPPKTKWGNISFNIPETPEPKLTTKVNIPEPKPIERFFRAPQPSYAEAQKIINSLRGRRSGAGRLKLHYSR